MSDNILTTTDITMPDTLLPGIWKKAQGSSVITMLSQAAPQMKYGSENIMTLDIRPRAEFVAEGAEKTPTRAKFGLRTVTPHKTQVTMRFDEEVKWADEDYQLGILKELADATGEALGRALDLGAIHAINPLTGLHATSITDYLMQTDKVVEAGKEIDLDIERAAGLIIAEHFRPSGVAFDLTYAWDLATIRYEDGRKKYPDLGLGLDITNFEGLPASVSDTVSGAPEAEEATGLLAVVGDWSAFRWGVQRKIGVTMIEYGDPDGQGDLKRKNQIALRAETVYGWCFIDKDAFAVIMATDEVG